MRLIFQQFFNTCHFSPLTDPIESESRKAKSRASARHNSIAMVLMALSFACLAATARDAGWEKPWSAPAPEAAKKNPVAASQDSVKAGERVYTKRCLNCHGQSGNGDGPDAADLGIHPAKFSDPRLRRESDGAFYWKITVGKKPMPGYGTRLSTTDRWNVINYLRTLSK
jgi:mono/diheme cytochrome c family protein